MDIVQVNRQSDTPPTVIGLGNFDGVHLGHQSLIDDVVRLANIEEITSSLLLFRTHTNTLLKQKKVGRYLTSNTQKAAILKDRLLDRIYVQTFDEAFSKNSPEDFVGIYLKEKLNVRAIVVGVNYTFGYKARGNIELLEKLCRQFDIELVVTPPVYYRDTMISSTIIRNLIEQGKIATANRLLSRPYTMKGAVETGAHRGRKLGFPTANIHVEFDYVYPLSGVYYTKVCVQGKWHDAMTSVGTNPTFTDEGKKKIENYLLDFDGQIYGENMEVSFLKFLRPIIKFEDSKALIEQIRKDEEHTRREIVRLTRDPYTLK
jgi:riboflavin kinase/FMN adenylyltransferase